MINELKNIIYSVRIEQFKMFYRCRESLKITNYYIVLIQMKQKLSKSSKKHSQSSPKFQSVSERKRQVLHPAQLVKQVVKLNDNKPYIINNNGDCFECIQMVKQDQQIKSDVPHNLIKQIGKYTTQNRYFQYSGIMLGNKYENAIPLRCTCLTSQCVISKMKDYFNISTVIIKYLLLNGCPRSTQIKLDADIHKDTTPTNKQQYPFEQTIKGHIKGSILINTSTYKILGNIKISTNLSNPKSILYPQWIFKNQKQLKLVNTVLANGNFNLLSQCWQHHSKQFIQNIQSILARWSQLSNQYQSQFIKLINVLFCRYINMPFVQSIYPGLGKLYSLLQKVVQTKANHKEIQPFNQMPDLLYQCYIQQIDQQNKRYGIYYQRDQKINKTVSLSQFIANKLGEQPNASSWKDILTKINLIKKTQKFNESQEKAVITEKQNRSKYRKEILHFNKNIIIDTNKICCASFFYNSWDIQYKYGKQGTILSNNKFLDLLIKQTEQNKLSKNKVYHSQKIKEILLDICALLNSTKGGIILFDTARNYLNIQVKGQIITEQEKKRAKIILKNQITAISPSVNIDREIFINYVPIVKEPYANGFEITQQQKLYIKGMYALRIVVKPIQHSKVYYISNGNQTNINDTAFIQQNKRIKLKSRSLIKIIKKKFNYHFIAEQEKLDEQEQLWISKTHNFNDHICQQPEKGLVLYKKQNIKAKGTAQSSYQYQNKYKYITLLLTNQNNISIIKEKLIEKGIDCEISNNCKKYKLKLIEYSVGLYHNVKFNHLLSVLTQNKQQLKLENQFLLMQVTKYLKLLNRGKNNMMPQKDCNILANQLKKEHPNQQLQLWSFQTTQQKIQFYIKTQSKISTLFIYFVLNHYFEKASFENPKDIQKMSKQLKQNKMKLHFPSMKKMDPTNFTSYEQ